MKKIVLAILFLAFITPVTAQTREEKKKIKEEKAAKEYALLKDFVNTKKFNFEATWATTQKGRRINMQSNPNYLKIDNSNAEIYLPFFGTSHSGGAGYGTDGGIVFEGDLEKYSVTFNDKKQLANIKFTAKAKSEIFDFTLTIYGNKNANLNVSSNSRSNMSYSGKIK